MAHTVKVKNDQKHLRKLIAQNIWVNKLNFLKVSRAKIFMTSGAGLRAMGSQAKGYSIIPPHLSQW